MATKGKRPSTAGRSASHERPALGRGLAALLPGAPVPAQPARGLLVVPLDQVHADREQPRQTWDVTRLEELAASIKACGIIQPILVRRLSDESYRIVAGERRWRAARLAGLTEVPIVVKEVSESEAFGLALVENIQRQDLNPIEEAEAYQRLLTDHGLKHDDLATRVGKERTTITNALRLLKLPGAVREQVAEGSISVGHAKVLLGVDDTKVMSALAHEVTERQLSVRALERLVQRGLGAAHRKPNAPAIQPIPAELRAPLKRLEKLVGVTCTIEMKSAEAGELTIRFSTPAKGLALLEALNGAAEPRARKESP